jgi:hypothetical protein
MLILLAPLKAPSRSTATSHWFMLMPLVRFERTSRDRSVVLVGLPPSCWLVAGRDFWRDVAVVQPCPLQEVASIASIASTFFLHASMRHVFDVDLLVPPEASRHEECISIRVLKMDRGKERWVVGG